MILTIIFIAIAAFCLYKINFSLDPLDPWYKRCLVIAIICIVLGIVSSVVSSFIDGGLSDWDKLTKEEKEWYKNNYGNGQYDSYKDAINDYYD